MEKVTRILWMFCALSLAIYVGAMTIDAATGTEIAPIVTRLVPLVLCVPVTVTRDKEEK